MRRALHWSGLMFLAAAVATVAALAIQSENGFEYWLNRYQTLVAAALALLAAYIAARPAWRQLAAIIGDLPPEFAIHWEPSLGSVSGHLEEAVLAIVNRNRRTIRIRRIRIVQPRGMHIHVSEWKPKIDAEGRLQRAGEILGERPDPSTWDVDYGVPHGGEAYLGIIFGDDPNPARSGHDEKVRFQIEYDLLGAASERHRIEVTGFVRRR